MPLTKDELMEFLASLPWKFNAQGYAIIKRSHVVLWADGRRLNPKDVVHHRNENKADDRPENLEVMSRKEHMRMHRIAQLGGLKLDKLNPEQKETLRQRMLGNKHAVGRPGSPEERELQSSSMREVWRRRKAGELPMPKNIGRPTIQ